METVIISGSSNHKLSASIAKFNKTKLAKVEIGRFPNKEKRIRILSDLKDKDVNIIQSTCIKPDEYLIETLLLADAAKRMGAKKITLVLPWFGYMPQDKVFLEGESLSSHVVIDFLNNSPIDEFDILDIHAKHLLEKFIKPVKHRSAMPLFVKHSKEKMKYKKGNLIAVAVDKGGLERAEEFSRGLGCGLVCFDKKRDNKTGEITFTDFYGSVEGKDVIAFDDYVSTGGTLIKSAQYLKGKGARSYTFCVTHIAVPKSLVNICNKPTIDAIITTNSIPFSIKSPKVVVLDLAGIYEFKYNN